MGVGGNGVLDREKLAGGGGGGREQAQDVAEH